jgi:hypothetical protein
MADFRTHMLTSTAVGALYGLAGYQSGVALPTCVLAGGLCSVSGMLPDLDSDSGRPLREATTLAAAVVPMLMVERFQRFGWGHETMVLAAAVLYLLIRFLITQIFRRFTVHRGMWHSIPAAIIMGMIAFLIMSSEDLAVRLFKTLAVVLGFVSHLVLDEIWSVEFRRGRYEFKSSFGSALKLWSSDRWANISTYAKLVGVSFLVYQDHDFMSHFGGSETSTPHTAREVLQIMIDNSSHWLR